MIVLIKSMCTQRAATCCMHLRKWSSMKVSCPLVKTSVAQDVMNLLESSVHDFTYLNAGWQCIPSLPALRYWLQSVEWKPHRGSFYQRYLGCPPGSLRPSPRLRRKKNHLPQGVTPAGIPNALALLKALGGPFTWDPSLLGLYTVPCFPRLFHSSQTVRLQVHFLCYYMSSPSSGQTPKAPHCHPTFLRGVNMGLSSSNGTKGTDGAFSKQALDCKLMVTGTILLFK